MCKTLFGTKMDWRILFHHMEGKIFEIRNFFFYEVIRLIPTVSLHEQNIFYFLFIRIFYFTKEISSYWTIKIMAAFKNYGKQSSSCNNSTNVNRAENNGQW